MKPPIHLLHILVFVSSVYIYCCLASNNTSKSLDGSPSTTIQPSRKTVGRTRASGRPTSPLTTNQMIASSRVTHSKSQTATSNLSQETIAKILAGYNNAPAVFATDTRDLFVDVARHRPGNRLATMQTIDPDGDPIIYSLLPAYPIARDASVHLSIEPTNGELRLNEQPFEYKQPTSIESLNDSSAPFERSSRNLYHLNVNAYDGHYNSTIELLVHVINSTYLSSPGVLIPLAPRAVPDSIVQQKSDEFYHKLLNFAFLSGTSTQLRPVLANPSLIRESQDDSSSSPPEAAPSPTPISTDTEEDYTPTDVSTSEKSSSILQSVITLPTPVLSSPPPVAADAEPTRQEQPKGQQGLTDSSTPAPLLIGLAIICSGLAITLVLLLFIIPLSFRRLRRRVKQVERKHERLSQQNSLDSSVLGTSSSLTSQTTHPTTREPSFSQLTYNFSDRLNFPQQQQLQKYQHPLCQPHFTQFDIHNNNNTIASSTKPFYQSDNTHTSTINLSPYCMLDDRLYSTIGVPEEPFEDFRANERTRSPDVQSTGSSTRSLARFLSLPARRHESSSKNNFDFEFYDSENQKGQQQQARGRTLARSSQVDQESQRKVESNSRAPFELERHKIHLQTLIGAGQFGSVWRAQLRYGNQTHEACTVAVKSVKKGAIQPQANEELLAEIELMKRVCSHPNVIRILHCCSSDSLNVTGSSNSLHRPILLVMEYAELGKLQSLLEEFRAHYTSGNSTTSPTLTGYGSLVHDVYDNQRPASSQADLKSISRELVKFIYHIAKGMEYVANQSVLHRDLASRNILVSSHRVCKIADFGMARLANNPDQIYERTTLNAKLPVRWWPPEALLNNRFTSRSDVFSFGILMWEIVTLGSTPYWHLKTEQVVEEVARHGLRPTRPSHCHSQLYQIMSSCWQNNESERPTFSELVRRLDQLILSENEYIQLDQYPDHNYYNLSKAPAPFELL